MSIIANKYKLIEKIKEGSFGSVFKGQNIRNGDLVAIKFEPKNDDKKMLKNEAKIYQYLGKLNGFPHLKWYGTTISHTYLVLDLLGISLSEMLKIYKRFSLKTTLLLGIQMIKIVELLHSKYLLHRDIKPDNFIFGLGTTTNKLHLIDFGFSKRYDYDGIHILEKEINNLIGSPNFVSLNVHNSIEPSRRDDLESCIYIIMNMFLGDLEWFNICNSNSNSNSNSNNISNSNNEMLLIKQNILSNLDGLSLLFIKKMLLYVRKLDFDETPNYNLLVKLISSEFIRNGFENDNIFEWS